MGTGGCASSNKRPWGEEATALPGWSAIKHSAYRAATDPKTWIPLGGAAVIYALDQDERISKWAVKHQPLFGNNADEVGSDLKDITDITYNLTVLFTPSGTSPGEWFVNKAKGLIVGNTAIAATSEVTDLLKERVGRLRPNELNDRSFISGHASYAAVRVSLAMRNVEYIEMPAMARTSSTAVLYAMNAGMAWSRVEAGVHYPSDVLAAMAVGNFMANFFTDAFLAPVTDDAALSVVPSRGGGVLLLLSVRY